MRLSTTTKTLVLTTVFFATPLLALAAPIPFFGPLIPQAGNQASCPANWGMVLIVLNNVIAFAITMAIVFVAPIMLAYAGFILVANPFNPGAKEQAKKMILNVVVGIVLALASWLIVNAIMAILYHPSDSAWGKWQELITSGDSPECIELASSLNPVEPGAGGVTARGGTPRPPPVSGDCSVDSLVAYGIDPAIASTMSCIAQEESSCNLTAQNPNSSATGLFQVVMGYDDQGHNLDFPVCTQAAQAAGYDVTGNLNCHSAVVRGGAPNPNNLELYNACVAASSNAQCNAQAAMWVYNHQGFRAWATHAACGV